MNGFPKRRLAAAAAATLALVVGGIGAGSAGAQGGSMSTPTSITTHTGLGVGFGLGGSTATPGAGLPGLGLFKALFALFGAVRTAVPTIAAPIVAQAVTAGTITPAEADQLTALLAGKHPTAMAGTTAKPAKPSAAEITVLHSVITAILGQLATIAAPVLATEVTAGDLTQAQADMIAKILTGLASIKSPLMSGLTTHAGGGMLTTSLAATVTAQVKQHVKGKHKHKRTHRSR
jgi:hypothetical protein